jgi:hypothetical protein
MYKGGIMVNYKSIVKELQKHYPDATEVAIIDTKGKILQSTTNWDIKGDIKALLSIWASGNAQFVSVNGVRYSILQMEPERFIATNLHKQGHFVGASSPDGKSYMIAHIKPKAKGWFHMAYPALARAAAMMVKGTDSKFMESEMDLSDVSESSTNQVESYQNKFGTRSIDPYLKAEIESFLEWIKHPEGFRNYIYYSLQQNDQYKISELAKIYLNFYNLFY